MIRKGNRAMMEEGVWKAGEAGGRRFKKQRKKLLASELLAEGGHEMGTGNEEQASSRVLLTYFY